MIFKIALSSIVVWSTFNEFIYDIYGVWFCVYVRGLSGSLKIWQGNCWFCMRLHFFIKASFIIDTKGLYCVTKGNISFSSLLFCFRSTAFLLWVLLLMAIFLSKLCGQPLSMHQPLFEIWTTSSEEFVGFSRLLVCQIHFNNWWVVRGENVYIGRFPFKMRIYVNDSFFSFFTECCSFVYNRVEKGCVSVRYFGRKFYSQ